MATKLEADVELMKAHLNELIEQQRAPMPTAPIGSCVVWHPRANKADTIAAIVTKVDGPGKVRLTIFPPRRMPEYKEGVLHVDSPIHKNRNNSVTVNGGSWEYPEGIKPPVAHYELHKQQLQVLIDQVNTDLASAKERLAEQRATAKERLAEQKTAKATA